MSYFKIPPFFVTAKMRLILWKNATRTTTTVHYNWALLNNRDVRDKYALAQRNKYDALQEKTETHTPNEETAVEFIRTKQRTKSRVPWRLDYSMQT